mgnify:CR=1 FL=1
MTSGPPGPDAQVCPAGAQVGIGVVSRESDCLNNRLGLPNKVFEYMHAGLAILANNAPELQRLVDGQAIGITIASLRPAEIEAGLRRLLEDQPARQQFQANALRLTQSTYHFGVEQQKWQRILQHLL